MKQLVLLAVILFCWGVTPIIEKIGLKNATPLAGATIRSIAITTCLILLTIISGKTKEISSASMKDVLTFSLSGFLAGLVAMLAYFELLREGETSSIVPVVATYPLITAVLSYFVLSESFTIAKLIGTGLIVFGIYLVKI